MAAAEAREVRQEEAAAATRQAEAAAAAKAAALQAETARLEVTLHEARAKLDGAVSAAEQRKQQALAAHRDLQRLEAEVRESESK